MHIFTIKKTIDLFRGVVRSLLCTWAFSSCSEWIYSLAAVMHLSLQRLLLLWCMGFSVAARGLRLPHSMRNFPGPGIRPVSPALAGGFLSMVPLGKFLCVCVCVSHSVMFVSLQPHSLSMGFFGQEYWSGLPFPSPGRSSISRDQTQVSCIGRWILYHLS